MQGLNKLFLHLTRALCLGVIMISHLVFFHVYYTLKNFTRAYIFQIALEIM